MTNKWTVIWTDAKGDYKGREDGLGYEEAEQLKAALPDHLTIEMRETIDAPRTHRDVAVKLLTVDVKTAHVHALLAIEDRLDALVQVTNGGSPVDRGGL